VAAFAMTVAACGRGSDNSSRGGAATRAVVHAAVATIPSGPRPVVSSLRSGKHDGFRVVIVTEHETGVVGKTLRSYHAEAHAVRPASACVSNRDRAFPAGSMGATLYATLDPARGEGGPRGWCRGLFRGTVRYHEAFACPPAGTYHRPARFPSRSEVVIRFSSECSDPRLRWTRPLRNALVRRVSTQWLNLPCSKLASPDPARPLAVAPSAQLHAGRSVGGTRVGANGPPAAMPTLVSQ
jgi:hypothetical protein